MTDGTIAALATPRGAAALAVVRVSGAQAIEIVARHFHPPGALARLASQRCAIGRFVDESGAAVDEVVATVFRAPASYTGEDLVEISAHGSDAITGRILAALHASGARPAQPGEFTRRAFLHGKMDLAQAEAVAALVTARSDASARAALRILAGGLRTVLDPSMERLLLALAGLEARLDLEDAAPDALASSSVTAGFMNGGRNELKALVREEIARLDRLLAGAQASRRLDDGLRVVLAGRPNAGKSSILNAFLSRPRAIVSPHPGTTRDALEAWVEWDGLPIVLVDTAGLSASDRPSASNAPSSAAAGDEGTRAERELADETHRRSHEALQSAMLVIQVVDAARTGPAEAAEDEEQMRVPPERIVIALHKWDLGPLPAWQRDDMPAAQGVQPASQGMQPGAQGHDPRAGAHGTARAAQGRGAIASSVVSAPGIEPLRAEIVERLRAAGEEAQASLLVGERQRDLVSRARHALVRAQEWIAADASDELAAFELREALDRLGEILGRRAGPLVLERIFSNFCVGK